MIALISVYDKAGVRELALNLAELGFDIYSTGGTQRHLVCWRLPQALAVGEVMQGESVVWG